MPARSPASRVVVALACLAAFAAVAALSAQTAPPSRHLMLTIVDLEPGALRAYIDHQKATVVPALQKGGVKWRDSWRTAVFGQTSQVAHVTEIATWDQFDGPGPLPTALGEAGYRAHLEKVAPMVARQQVYAIRTRPDLSYFADPAVRPKMAIFTRVDVKADKLADFERFLKGEWITALKKGGGKHYAVSQVVYGGSTTEYLTLVGIDSFAELGKGHPVVAALGDEGVVKMMATSGLSTQRIERTVIRLDPEMSFGARTP